MLECDFMRVWNSLDRVLGKKQKIHLCENRATTKENPTKQKPQYCNLNKRKAGFPNTSHNLRRRNQGEIRNTRLIPDFYFHGYTPKNMRNNC